MARKLRPDQIMRIAWLFLVLTAAAGFVVAQDVPDKIVFPSKLTKVQTARDNHGWSGINSSGVESSFDASNMGTSNMSSLILPVACASSFAVRPYVSSVIASEEWPNVFETEARRRASSSIKIVAKV